MMIKYFLRTYTTLSKMRGIFLRSDMRPSPCLLYVIHDMIIRACFRPNFVPSADAVDAVEFDGRSREEGPITVHPPPQLSPPPPFHVASAVVPRLDPRSNWRIKSGVRNPRGIASITVSDLIHNYLFKFNAQVQCLAMKWWTHRAYRTRDVQIRALLQIAVARRLAQTIGKN
jgi:hypothetical protein